MQDDYSVFGGMSVRITKKVFYDLAILMVFLGVSIGIVFPYFCIALGVPREIALTPTFFTACVAAGVVLAVLNITLARKTVGSRITLLSSKMKHIEDILVNSSAGISAEECTPDNCLIDVDSDDELGESANSFNKLVVALADVLRLNSEIHHFSNILTSHLEIDALSDEALNNLIRFTGAVGGAFLIEKGGELVVKAAVAIKEPGQLAKNDRLLYAMKTHERQTIRFPDDVRINGVIVDFQPNELFIEPILYKNTLLGILVLVGSAPFPEQMLSRLPIFNQELSLALRNAITHDQMTHFAAIDPLTGLYNRRFGIRRLHEEFQRSIRSGTPLSVLMLDIDHFKALNDSYGHMAGDRVLILVSKIAGSSIREGDILMRYGGEEFLCVLPGAGPGDASKIAERIRIMIMNSRIQYDGQDIQTTVSIGIASYPRENMDNPDQLIKLADEAMYDAKTSGRNKVVTVS